MDLIKSYYQIPYTKYIVRLQPSVIYRTVGPQPYVKLSILLLHRNNPVP